MPQFKDLKSPDGLAELNSHLESRSYIEGVIPSEADVSTLEALGKAPENRFPHVLRWYNHISSFPREERSNWAKGAGVSGGAVENGAADDDEDIDLFGSDDDEDAEKERVKQERLKAYEEKKAKKPAGVAKSQIVLDVKPWDDETDLKEVEKLIREIEADGLVWGQCKTRHIDKVVLFSLKSDKGKYAKLVPVAYGIKKIQIACVVEDDKIGTDFLEDQITAFEDYVQSVDIAAFQKI